VSDENKPCDATPAKSLRERIMDSRIPKNEAEWWANRRIEELERENAELRVYSDDMTDQFFAVSQENAALRDDKKLVDWLAENEASAIFEPGDPEVGLFPAWSVYYNDRELPVVHADLRAAINAARAKKGGAT
jgi:hypothetical protein